MSVGDRIKELREAKGWSQTKLANEVKKLGGKLSQQNVANIESGIVKSPKALLSLAAVFNVRPEWLQDGEGAKEADKAPTANPPPPGSLVQGPKGRPIVITSHHVVWDRFVKFARKEGLTLKKIAEAAGLPSAAASKPAASYPEQVETLRKLMMGAAKLTKRHMTAEELESELAALAREDEAPRPREVAVRSYVGAGDEIIPFDDEEPLYWTPAPPGLEDAEATQVRGASMFPAYEDGDVLFHRRHNGDPTPFLGRVVILQTRSRKRYVKVLQAGTKRGHFDLVSFNRLSPTIENQQLLWVAPILWVKKRQRF